MHSLVQVNPCCLIPTTFSSFTCLEMLSRRPCLGLNWAFMASSSSHPPPRFSKRLLFLVPSCHGFWKMTAAFQQHLHLLQHHGLGGFQNETGQGPGQSAPVDPALKGGARLADLQRLPSAPTVLWFSVYVQLILVPNFLLHPHCACISTFCIAKQIVQFPE